MWAPGVVQREEANSYLNRLILEELEDIQPQKVLDLGCGVGGTLVYLATQLPHLSATGITISPEQVRMGREILDQERLTGRIKIRLGDMAMPVAYDASEGLYDAAYAIESLIHVRDQEAVWRELRERIRPGGLFLALDDFLLGTAPASRRQEALEQDFVEGWKSWGLRSLDVFIAQVEAEGFKLELSRDLSPYLELGRPRDLAIRAFLPFLKFLAYRRAWMQNMRGGNALQLLLKEGRISYQFLRFRRL